MRRNRKANRPVSKPSWRKASGDDKFYFILHNLLSMGFFFYAGIQMGLFERQSFNLLDIITFNFLQFVGVVIGLTFLFGVCSRYIIYGLFKVINNHENKKRGGSRITTIKSFRNMNQGINEFTTYSYLKALFWSSLAFCLGATTLLQIKLFRSIGIWSLIGAYLIIKVSIYAWIWHKDK